MSNISSKKWKVTAVSKTNTNTNNTLVDKLSDKLNELADQDYSPEFIFEPRGKDDILIVSKKNNKPKMV